MVLYDVPAPAKLNLFLHVVGRRADGYHLLQTAFRLIGLADTLNFETRSDGRIVRAGSLPGLAPEDDLIVKAALALQRATGTRQGAHIDCVKRIPSGGGLGGGSSDAASTLIALNRLWNTGLTRAELMRLALALGADVPVFVFGRNAFAEGIGEVLTALDLPERAYLVAQPRQAVPTQGIFQAPDLTRNTPSIKITVFADWQQAAQEQGGKAPHKKAQHGNTPDCALFGRNDLEPVVIARYPAVGLAQEWLRLQEVNTRMTGSGACLFAEFVTLEQARSIQQKIVGKIAACSEGRDVDEAAAQEANAVQAVQEVWACPGLFEHPLRHWIHD